MTCWLLSPGAEAEPVLVDTPAPRRQTLEPEQLPHGHDPGPGWGGRDPGAHPLQGHLLPHVGGSLLVRGTVMWALGSGSADSDEFLLVFSCKGTWEGATAELLANPWKCLGMKQPSQLVADPCLCYKCHSVTRDT